MTQTPSQTIGPYFAYGLTPGQYGYQLGNICGPQLADASAKGENITIKGRVLDVYGVSINDAMIEIWQADSKGEFHKEKNNGFISFGRCGTGMNDENKFEFHTVKPGPVEGHAPFVNVIVFMRGLLSHMYTRIYFADENNANANDETLNAIEESRRSTLIAHRSENDGRVVYEFDIHMQGESETVFFDY